MYDCNRKISFFAGKTNAIMSRRGETPHIRDRLEKAEEGGRYAVHGNGFNFDDRSSPDRSERWLSPVNKRD